MNALMIKHAFERLLPGEIASTLSARATAVGWALSIRLPARWRVIVDFIYPRHWSRQ
jgi:hypothetical protein